MYTYRCAVLRFACGAQRQQGYAKLQAAITDGDVSMAASMAQELHPLATPLSLDGAGATAPRSSPIHTWMHA